MGKEKIHQTLFNWNNVSFFFTNYWLLPKIYYNFNRSSNILQKKGGFLGDVSKLAWISFPLYSVISSTPLKFVVIGGPNSFLPLNVQSAEKIDKNAAVHASSKH